MIHNLNLRQQYIAEVRRLTEQEHSKRLVRKSALPSVFPVKNTEGRIIGFGRDLEPVPPAEIYADRVKREVLKQAQQEGRIPSPHELTQISKAAISQFNQLVSQEQESDRNSVLDSLFPFTQAEPGPQAQTQTEQQKSTETDTDTDSILKGCFPQCLR